MAERKGSRFRWVLLALAAAGAMIVLGACVGPVVLLLLAPMTAQDLVLSDEPLPGGAPSLDLDRTASLLPRVCPALESGARVELTAEDWVQLAAIAHPWPLGSERFALTVDDGVARFELSMNDPAPDGRPRYINLVLAGAFVIERGRFSSLTVDEARLGSLRFGWMFLGRDLARDTNRQLASEDSRELRELLAPYELLATVDDGFAVIAPGRWVACAGLAPDLPPIE